MIQFKNKIWPKAKLWTKVGNHGHAPSNLSQGSWMQAPFSFNPGSQSLLSNFIYAINCFNKFSLPNMSRKKNNTLQLVQLWWKGQNMVEYSQEKVMSPATLAGNIKMPRRVKAGFIFTVIHVMLLYLSWEVILPSSLCYNCKSVLFYTCSNINPVGQAAWHHLPTQNHHQQGSHSSKSQFFQETSWGQLQMCAISTLDLSQKAGKWCDVQFLNIMPILWSKKNPLLGILKEMEITHAEIALKINVSFQEYKKNRKKSSGWNF